MMGDIVPPNATPLRLTAAIAQQRIRAAALAGDGSNIRLTQHARLRMQERGIDLVDVLEILRKGFVDERPVLNENGNWQCLIERELIIGRTAACVTIVLRGDRLKVRTVMWRDGK